MSLPVNHASRQNSSLVFLLVTLLASPPCRAQSWCGAPRNSVFSKYEKLGVSDGWFEVYQLPGGVYALFEPRQGQQVFSYLITGRKRALLFDSGLGIGRIDQVVRRLTSLPVVVLNSHTHFDHIGGNYAFSEILAVDSAYTRKNAQGLPNARVAEELSSGEVCPPLPAGVRKENYRIRPFGITDRAFDGQRVDLGGRELELIATPGHTPDSICLLDRAHRELFTGDTFYPGALWLWVPETDLDAYQRSIERLAALAPLVNMLRPAHNLPEADPTLLGRVAEALPKARAGKVPFTVENDRRVHRFTGFTIVLANPR